MHHFWVRAWDRQMDGQTTALLNAPYCAADGIIIGYINLYSGIILVFIGHRIKSIINSISSSNISCSSGILFTVAILLHFLMSSIHYCVQRQLSQLTWCIPIYAEVNILLGSHMASVLRAFCNGRHVCRLSCIRSWKLSEIGAEFRRHYRKSGSLGFASEVAKYPKSSPTPNILLRSISDAACYFYYY